MGDNQVHPGAGDDVVEDVDGDAMCPYWNAPGPIEVDLATGIATGWGIDQLVGVAEVHGSRFDDVMRGGPAGGRFHGLGGDDVLEAVDFADPNTSALEEAAATTSSVAAPATTLFPVARAPTSLGIRLADD